MRNDVVKLHPNVEIRQELFWGILYFHSEVEDRKYLRKLGRNIKL